MTAGSVGTFSSLNLIMTQSNDGLVELPSVVEGVVGALMAVVEGVVG
jgi:hypothetical protein